jgi:hypothetical protein
MLTGSAILATGVAVFAVITGVVATIAAGTAIAWAVITVFDAVAGHVSTIGIHAVAQRLQIIDCAHSVILHYIGTPLEDFEFLTVFLELTGFIGS